MAEATRRGEGDPSARSGCEECEAEGGWWFHLRRCTDCGHIGCCDSSPGQHARAHAREAGHPRICSYEPGEDWCWSFETGDYVEVPREIAALHHPRSQAVPGPRERVPSDWMAQLN